MKFPVFLLPAWLIIIACAAAVPAAVTAVYLQVYKRHVNKALRQGGSRPAMAPPCQVAVILTVAVLFLGVIVSLLAGYKLACDAFEENMDQLSALDLQTYYAEVKAVGEHSITVEGISLNEEAYRGEFRYEVWGETSIVRQNTLIALSDLEPGDLVCVTLITGEGRLGGVTGLFKIQLLQSGT